MDRTRGMRGGALIGVLALLTAGQVQAQAVRNLSGFQSNTLQANDDGSTGSVALPFTLNFFGNTFSSLFVNNNGNVTLSGPLPTFTPFGLTTNIGTPIIAPFFADVDTRGPSLAGSANGGGNTSNTPEPFDGSGLVTYGAGVVDGHDAFGVDWFSDCANWTGGLPGPTCTGLIGDGYYQGHTDPSNIFQLVLISRPDLGTNAFDIEFNYNQVLWNTGDASGGTGGRGGSPARVGFSNGTGSPGSFFEMTGSGVDGAFLDGGPAGTSLIHNSLNSGVQGRYVFSVIGGRPITNTPEPFSMGLVATGLAGVALARRRRRRERA